MLVLLLFGACAGDMDTKLDSGAADMATTADSARVDSGAADSAPPGSDAVKCPSLTKMAGTYSGTFKGTISTLGASSGTVTFNLTKKGVEEFLTIGAGKMSGKVQNSLPYSSDLQGTVKCGAFAAKIVNGKAGTVTFQGTMAAPWSSTGFSGGTWKVTYAGGSTLGSGTWEAKGPK